MKKIVYSTALKLVAVILLIASVSLGALTAVSGLIRYNEEEQDIYSFERNFSESWYLAYLLSRPENIVFDAYYRCFGEREPSDSLPEPGEEVEDEIVTEEETVPDDETVTEEQTETETAMETDLAGIAESLNRMFEDFYDSEKINYFVQWNDLVFTNCNAATAEELMQGEYYTYLKRDDGRFVDRTSTARIRTYLIEDLERFDKTSTMVIACSVKEDVAREYRAIWEKQERIVWETVLQTLICAASALLLFIYLLAACGKNKDGTYTNMWLDRIWLEVHLAAMVGAGIGAVAVFGLVMDEYLNSHFPSNLVYWITGTVSALGSLVIITSLLSVVRNIKTRRLPDTSVILSVVRWILRLIVKILRGIGRGIKAFFVAVIRLLSRKTGVILISMLMAYTALVAFFVIISVIEPVCIVFGISVLLFACFVVAHRAKDLDEVKKGVNEVRGGNVAYQIPELKCEDMKALATDINGIAKGLDESVAAKVKAERLKTELITNVSHDLKTPITSIIGYTELLSHVEGLPEEARDYVAVIAKKSDRLKRLTQDLFDISKVQSGNDDVVFEKLDMALLIEQALGEHDREIQESGLTFCVNAPKELYISADGRKMARVLSNLIHNVLKYSMKNTRVFMNASEREGRVILELKNISAYPLSFNAEDITKRFVRGDESRTTEGNGLGLAIAKSYTEICNGSLEIVVDGDMFKAVLTFDRYSA